jgi:hypothetical protein
MLTASITGLMNLITLMMELVRTSETSVYSNVTAQRFIQEGFFILVA